MKSNARERRDGTRMEESASVDEDQQLDASASADVLAVRTTTVKTNLATWLSFRRRQGKNYKIKHRNKAEHSSRAYEPTILYVEAKPLPPPHLVIISFGQAGKQAR